MTIAGQANVAAARTTFETLVNGALQQQRSQGLWMPFAAKRSGVGSRKVTFTEVGATPDYEEWEGDKNYRGFRKRTISCSFKKYHKSMDLQREEVVHDQDGSTAAAISAFVSDVGYVYDKVVFDMLKSNPTVADGTLMLANTHNHGTYDNLAAALTWTTFDAGLAAMENQTDEWGEYLGVKADYMLVNPADARFALEMAGADRTHSVGTAGGIDSGGIGAVTVANVHQGRVKVVVCPRWTSGDWLLMDSRFPPIGLAVWREPTISIVDSMESEERHKRDRFLYSVEADINACGLSHHGVYGYIA